MTWISQTTSADQGLIYDEATGRNIAVAYDSEDGPRIADCVNACRGMDSRAVPLMACAVVALVNAYKRGEEEGASIEWSDLDLAHEFAVQAVECFIKPE